MVEVETVGAGAGAGAAGCAGSCVCCGTVLGSEISVAIVKTGNWSDRVIPRRETRGIHDRSYL
jgi:hypothetical protein